jgi:hypothetical protein
MSSFRIVGDGKPYEKVAWFEQRGNCQGEMRKRDEINRRI